MKSFRLEISTPAGSKFDGEAVQLSVRAIDGELAILAEHIPLATAVVDSECRVYLTDGSVKNAHCGGGMLIVSKEKTQLLTSVFDFSSN